MGLLELLMADPDAEGILMEELPEETATEGDSYP